uniref:Uncharacterized protein n=1 Tax=Parastrongyloides trichosuri TaxID=131310 RepID=A0A0N5A2C8_PARTI
MTAGGKGTLTARASPFAASRPAYRPRGAGRTETGPPDLRRAGLFFYPKAEKLTSAQSGPPGRHSCPRSAV